MNAKPGKWNKNQLTTMTTTVTARRQHERRWHDENTNGDEENQWYCGLDTVAAGGGDFRKLLKKGERHFCHFTKDAGCTSSWAGAQSNCHL